MFNDRVTGFVSRAGCGEDERCVKAVLPAWQDLAKGSLARGKASDMGDGSGRELVNGIPMGLAAARGLGTGSWRGYLVLKKEVGQCS